MIKRLSIVPLFLVTGVLTVLAMPSANAQLTAAGAALIGVGGLWHQTRQQNARTKIMRDAISLTGHGAMLLSADYKIKTVNEHFTHMSGYTQHDVQQQPMMDFIAPRYGKALSNTIWDALISNGEWEGEVWCQHKLGYEYPEWRRIRAVKNAFGRVTGFIAVMADLAKGKAQDIHLNHQRCHDDLTGLPSRQRILDLLAFQLFRLAGDHSTLATLDIAIIDIDAFQMINSNWGYEHGDELLISFGRRLTQSPDATMVGRLGGDEFFVMHESLSEPWHDHHRWMERLHESLMKPFTINGESLCLSVSIGSYRVTRVTPSDCDASNIMQGMELALNRAKRSGSNTWRLHTPALDAVNPFDMTLIQALRTALMADDQLNIHYQSQHNTLTGDLIGYEALLRWNHPDMGMISPADFIPLAERHGIIEQLGRWVIHSVVAQLAEWRDNRKPMQVIWVNVSAIQLQLGTLEGIINTALREFAIPAHWLGLELTESMFLDDRCQNVIKGLRKLKNNGHSIAIDDFGTGHSSLSYLRNLPVDKVKLDRSFILGIPNDMANVTIIRFVLAIATNMKLEVVAEGVETPEQRDFLRKEGCHAIQGYLYSKPKPFAALTGS
jgi:diguanylate cyclase (GGDEF)-like protein/PAS domain S-box-containing protein